MTSFDWTPELDSKLRELHAQGKGDTIIARELDAVDHPNQVTRRRRRLGLLPVHVERAGLREAREARLAQERDDLEEALLGDAVALRERLWDTYEIVVSGPTGPERMTLDLPDAKAAADLTAAIERLLKSHENLRRIGAASSTDIAKANLTQLLDLMRSQVDHLTTDEDTDDDG